jgi:aryl-alcohol dehydrogenase-like predicted oxidoreductase
VLPVAQRYRMGVLTWSQLASGFLSGAQRKGRPVDLTTGRAALTPSRFDPALPHNAAKLELVEQLVEVADGVGCSLPQLAIAFTLAHPAVTSTIIGPRTREQLESLLDGAELALDDATLDRIDAIVPPGSNAYHPDGAWTPASLSDPVRRRRPANDRSAV